MRFYRKCRIFSVALQIEQIAQPEIFGCDYRINSLHVRKTPFNRDTSLLTFRQQIRLQMLVLPGNRASCLRASKSSENGAEFASLTLQILCQELLKRRSSPQILDIGKHRRIVLDVLNRSVTKQ